MTITLTPDLEAGLTRAADARGVTPEALALESLRERFADQPVPREQTIVQTPEGPLPLDELMRRLRAGARNYGVSLTNEQLSREHMYD